MQNRDRNDGDRTVLLLSLETPERGQRHYCGAMEDFQRLAEHLTADPLWASVAGDNGEGLLRGLRTARLLQETSVRYPLIRWDYYSLSGESYRLRAENASLRYSYVEAGDANLRFVAFRLERVCYDRYSAPRGWRPITGDFLGVPHTLEFADDVLESRVSILDGTFASRRELVADLLCQPPELNLQCAMDEIFSPA